MSQIYVCMFSVCTSVSFLLQTKLQNLTKLFTGSRFPLSLTKFTVSLQIQSRNIKVNIEKYFDVLYISSIQFKICLNTIVSTCERTSFQTRKSNLILFHFYNFFVTDWQDPYLSYKITMPSKETHSRKRW